MTTNTPFPLALYRGHPGVFSKRRPGLSNPARQGQRGVAIVVVVVLLAVMLSLVMANSRTLALLKRELQLVEAKQQKRLADGAKPADMRMNHSNPLPPP